jgi:hypothetical protein
MKKKRVLHVFQKNKAKDSAFLRGFRVLKKK